MDRRQFTRMSLVAGPLAGWAGAPWAFSLSEGDAAQGVRTALERGALSAVGLLGRNDGFLANPKVRIPLPGVLNDMTKIARATGQGRRVDDLVTAMNRAAEQAVPQARSLLVNAAKTVTVDDAVRIVRGGDTSVTQYFSSRTRTPLAEKFLPIVTQATERVALADKYNALAAKASRLGLVKAQDANLQQYVTGKALDGLFFMIGEEEKKIRRDPVGTGSAILRKVFGL